MQDEILAAVLFLVRIIEKNEKFSREKLDLFKLQLIDLLTERFQNHWFPDCPAKGQGYRCIRLNGLTPVDYILEKAATLAGLSYRDLRLPMELTLWVDPNEVCCRFGETEGSYCTLASFHDKENQMLVAEQIDRALTASPGSDGGSSGSSEDGLVFKPVSPDSKRSPSQRKYNRSRNSLSSPTYKRVVNGPNTLVQHRNGNHPGLMFGHREPWRSNYDVFPQFSLQGNGAGAFTNGGYNNHKHGYNRVPSQFHNILTV